MNNERVCAFSLLELRMSFQYVKLLRHDNCDTFRRCLDPTLWWDTGLVSKCCCRCLRTEGAESMQGVCLPVAMQQKCFQYLWIMALAFLCFTREFKVRMKKKDMKHSHYDLWLRLNGMTTVGTPSLPQHGEFGGKNQSCGHCFLAVDNSVFKSYFIYHHVCCSPRVSH